MVRRVADETNLESLNLPCQLLQQYMPFFSWRRTSWWRNRRARGMRLDPTTLHTTKILVEVITTGASCWIRRGQGGQEGMIGWREGGRRWNPVIATGEGEEHHANSGHQEEQSDGGHLGDWQMGRRQRERDIAGDHF